MTDNNIELTTAQIDEQSRERIKTDLDTNFFVEAGAGSGKTTLLVQRMVALIKNGADISRIAAITFTKAAAREFYGRFQKALDREIHNEKNTAEQRNRCETALRDIDLCFLNTIDSFCQTVMNEHPVETGIPFGSRVVMDDDEAAARERVLDEALRGELDGEAGTSLAELYEQMAVSQKDPREAVINGMGQFFSTRDMKRFVPEYEYVDIDTEFSPLISKLREITDVLKRDKDSLYYYGNKTAAGDLDSFLKKRGAFYLDSWAAGATGLFDALNAFRKVAVRALPDVSNEAAKMFKYFENKNGGHGYKVEGSEGDREIIHAQTILKKRQYMTYVRFMDAFTRAASKRLHERGELDFFDYLHSLRDSLRRDVQSGGRLAAHIYSRHSYFLIDEFQDTDPVQAEVFFRLASDNCCDDWRECVPRPGSLFIVGDPKQSIYRFKNADVASFLRVREMFTGSEVGEVLHLYRNFRSVPKLRGWFNGTFPRMLRDGEYQSGFESIPDNRRDGEIDHTGLFEGVGGFTVGFKEQYLCPPMIANIVANITDSDEHMIWDRDSGERRRIRFSDIMIITWTKGKQEDIIGELTKRGIPYIVEGKTEFHKQPELKALVSVFGALTYPDDPAYVCAALMSAAFGLPGDVIQNEVSEGLELRLRPRRGRKATKGAAGAITLLTDLYAESKRLTPYDIFIRAAELLRGHPSMREAHEQSREDYFWYAAELLRKTETDGKCESFGARAVYELLCGLMSADNKKEREMALERELDRVHIANLHKVKGLEAPVVILACNGEKAKNEAVLNDYAAQPPECTILNVSSLLDNNSTVEYAAIGGYDTSDFVYSEDAAPMPGKPSSKKKKAAEDEIQWNPRRKTAVEQAEAESIRKEYVAATRARSALMICGIHSEKNGKIVGLTDSSCWRRLYPDDLLHQYDDGFWDDAPEYALDIRAETVDNKKRTPEPSYGDDAESVLKLLEPCMAKSYERRLPSKMTAPRRETSESELYGMICDSESVPDGEAPEKGASKKADAALTGTLIHRAMELLALAGCEYQPAELAHAVVSGFELTDAQREKASADIVNVVKKLNKGGFRQKNGYTSDILAELKAADEVMCETPFCVGDGGTDGVSVIYDGVIDLIYHKNGEWHIVDYKTNADGDGLEEHYAGQLAAYQKAFEKMTGEKAQTHIYHIELS